MNNLVSLLASTSNATDAAQQAFETFVNIVNIVLPVLMSFLLVVGLFYGIQLGVKYAKAEDDEAKKQAKGQLINVIVGVLIAIIFVAVVEIILNQNFVGRLFYDLDANTGIV